MTAALELLDFQPIWKGALIGKARVRMGDGLEISDICLFQKEGGRRWAQLPAEIDRDYSGQPLKDERGKTRYRSALKWSTRALQDEFSHAVLAAVEAEHGTLDAAEASPQPAGAATNRRPPPSKAAPPDDSPFFSDEIPFVTSDVSAEPYLRKFRAIL
jgi:hypothetical protein